MSKCSCGGKLKSSYKQTMLGGWVCFLSCSKSKWEVYGGSLAHTKKEAYQMALEKLKKLESEHE